MKKLKILFAPALFCMVLNSQAQTPLKLTCSTFGNTHVGESFNCWWGIDTTIQEYDGWFPDPSIYLAWIPDTSCAPLDDSVVNIGQLNVAHGSPGRPRPSRYFAFRNTSPAQMDSLDDFLMNDINPNDLFILYSFIYFDKGMVAVSNPNIITTMRNMGFYGIDTMPSQAAFIFMGKKGDVSLSAYKYGADIDEDIYLEKMYTCGIWESVPEQNQRLSFSVFPNPSNGSQITINITNYVLAENNLVTISDETGRNVYSKIIKSNGNSIRLADLNLGNGIYFVSLTDNKTVFAKSKLVVDGNH